MNDTEFAIACQISAKKFTEVYAELCVKLPKMAVLTALTGALAAYATEAEQPRDRVLDALNSCFDDIEAGDEEQEF